VQLLHKSILDDQVLQNPDLRAELSRLQSYWRTACDVMIYKADIPNMPAEEAEYASDWCIRLAEEIVDAERAFRSGRRPSGGLDSCRHWVWERFENLDRGLMSNGIPRPSKK